MATDNSDDRLDIDILGRYKILKLLGSGAMGVVYQAVDPVIDRVVAIKTINLKLSREDVKEYEARFNQEIKAAGKLNHPNIVTIYDVGKTEQFAYMAMEYIEGDELKALLADEKPLGTVRAIDMAAQIADGLAFAHSRDIIHRDVKPSNIMISETEDGMVAKVMDFGIARMPTSSVKTQTGMILGSPRYMSPEQVVGHALGPRTDIFSLGVVLQEALTGVPPFEGPSINSIMYATVNTAPAAPSVINPDVPMELDAIVAKALSKAPDERYESMREFARVLHDALRKVESGEWKPVPLSERPAPVEPPEPAAPGPQVSSGRLRALSSQFDSKVGTLRLAAFTGQHKRAEELLKDVPDVGGNIAALVKSSSPASATNAPKTKSGTKPPSGSLPPSSSTKTGSPPPIYRGDETQFKHFSEIDLQPPGGTPARRRRIPVGPALLLGSMSAIAVALGIALIV
jgi:eukaryotic-like serine/threonine-protein kinase